MLISKEEARPPRRSRHFYNILVLGGLINVEECVQLLKAGLRSRKLNVKGAGKFSSAVSKLNQGELDATQGRA